MACIYQLGTDTDEVRHDEPTISCPQAIPREDTPFGQNAARGSTVQVDALTRKYHSAVPPVDEERESYTKQSMCITAHQVPGTAVQHVSTHQRSQIPTL